MRFYGSQMNSSSWLTYKYLHVILGMIALNVDSETAYKKAPLRRAIFISYVRTSASV